MLGGLIKVDGHTTLNLGMGDRVQLSLAKNMHLKCMKLVVWLKYKDIL